MQRHEIKLDNILTVLGQEVRILVLHTPHKTDERNFAGIVTHTNT
jgi:hypothetical protein